MEDLAGRLAAWDQPADPEALQSMVFAVGKDHGFEPLRDWFAARGALDRVEIVSLAEEWGPAAEGADIDGIVVSEGTREAAARLNARRFARGLAVLEVVTVPHLLAADGLPVSASRIRAGEVDADGRQA